MLQKSFNAFVPLQKSSTSPEGDWLVSGPVYDKEEDYDGEVLEKGGILNGLEMFKKLGWQVDYDHMYPRTKDPKYIIGKGVSIDMVGGEPYLTTRLFKHKPLAKSIWDHLQDQEAVMGYSIDGIVKARDGKRVTDTEIHRITIAPSPKGFNNRIKVGSAAIGLLKAIADAAAEEGGWEEVPDVDDDVQKAVDEARYSCPGCGRGMYCIHCHKKGSATTSSNPTPGQMQIENKDIKKSFDDDDQPRSCQMCEGPLETIGQLGNLNHMRCRNCGMMHSFPAEEERSEKSLTTGSGIVAEGETSGAALREQELKGADDDDKCEGCDKCKDDCTCASKAIEAVASKLKKMGVRNPAGIGARIIEGLKTAKL